MRPPHPWALERRGIIVLAGSGLSYAVLASWTRPFTWGADVVTAVPLVIGVAVMARVIPIRRGATENGGAGSTIDAGPSWVPGFVVWMVPVLAVVGWELYCLSSLPRAAHPTLSALLDIVDSTRVGKTIACASWLVGGWFLVTA
ncbi:MAG TPA: hypothetical protein VII76_05245 [Acidimicrobiales bacterium]